MPHPQKYQGGKKPTLIYYLQSSYFYPLGLDWGELEQGQAGCYNCIEGQSKLTGSHELQFSSNGTKVISCHTSHSQGFLYLLEGHLAFHHIFLIQVGFHVYIRDIVSQKGP